MEQLRTRLEKLGVDELVRQLDAEDPLAKYRSEFYIPQTTLPNQIITNGICNGINNGIEKVKTTQDAIYLCGNSLGLQPKSARVFLEKELDRWSQEGVEGQLCGDEPWVDWDEVCLSEMSTVVGAEKDEVVLMNSLTVNIHLMLAAFYNPTPKRFRILTHASAFPSDTMALRSHTAHRDYDPDEALIFVKGTGETGELFREEDFIAELEKSGDEIALIWVEGVHYLTGQRLDMARLAEEGRKHGVLVGLDLAHAVGNVELKLHDWGVDFAVWCSYKYLNSGPGGIGGCFVHKRHHTGELDDSSPLPRLCGWWSSRKNNRFRMDAKDPLEGSALGFQISNPPILCLATLRASLQIYSRIGMDNFRKKSDILTGLLEVLLKKELGSGMVKVITPSNSRGCQLTLSFTTSGAREVLAQLKERGVICDFREPDRLRVAPNPLYNSFEDVTRFVGILKSLLSCQSNGHTELR